MPASQVTKDYEALLVGLRDMPRSEAEALLDKLISDRNWIDSQITMFQHHLRSSANGGGPPATAAQQDVTPKLSRRMILLTEMSKAHDHPWTTDQLRAMLVDRGSIKDDSDGTATLHKNLGRMKRRKEIELVSRARYRLTPIGIEAVRAAT